MNTVRKYMNKCYVRYFDKKNSNAGHYYLVLQYNYKTLYDYTLIFRHMNTCSEYLLQFIRKISFGQIKICDIYNRYEPIINFV